MTTFILLAALLAAIAIVLTAWPLFRPAKGADGKPVGASRSAAVAVAVAFPVAAFVLYFTLSEWPWDGSAQSGPAGQGGDNAAASLTQMASQMEERLQREKGDVDGWKLLGRTYVMMGDFDKALKAYGQAYTLTSGADTEALLGYAEARVLVNEADFEGEAGRLFEKAVQVAPSEPKALWYGGLTAYRKQDLPTARARWGALREMGGPAEIMQILDQRLAEIDAQIGPPAAATVAAQPDTASAQAPVPATAAATAKDEPVPADGIPLRIEVAPALATRVPPGQTLFVLARSAGGGPPLAALRRSSSELPFDITLTDANAMIPGTSLKQVDSLTLVARVSLTGRPIASKGDLYGEVRYDPASQGRIKLTIDRVVE